MARCSLVSHPELTSYCCTHSHASCQPLTLSSQDYSLQTRILPLTHTHTLLPTSNRSSSPTDYTSQKYLWTLASAAPALSLLTISQFVLSRPSLIRSLISCFDLLYYNFPLAKKLFPKHVLFSRTLWWISVTYMQCLQTWLCSRIIRKLFLKHRFLPNQNFQKWDQGNLYLLFTSSPDRSLLSAWF